MEATCRGGDAGAPGRWDQGGVGGAWSGGAVLPAFVFSYWVPVSWVARDACELVYASVGCEAGGDGTDGMKRSRSGTMWRRSRARRFSWTGRGGGYRAGRRRSGCGRSWRNEGNGPRRSHAGGGPICCCRSRHPGALAGHLCRASANEGMHPVSSPYAHHPSLALSGLSRANYANTLIDG